LVVAELLVASDSREGGVAVQPVVACFNDVVGLNPNLQQIIQPLVLTLSAVLLSAALMCAAAPAACFSCRPCCCRLHQVAGELVPVEQKQQKAYATSRPAGRRPAGLAVKRQTAEHPCRSSNFGHGLTTARARDTSVSANSSGILQASITGTGSAEQCVDDSSALFNKVVAAVLQDNH
jgi:hypothetical protein